MFSLTLNNLVADDEVHNLKVSFQKGAFQEQVFFHSQVGLVTF